MEQVRINCMFTKEGVKRLDKLRAILQLSSTKPLTRPDVLRMAVEELLKQREK